MLASVITYKLLYTLTLSSISSFSCRVRWCTALSPSTSDWSLSRIPICECVCVCVCVCVGVGSTHDTHRAAVRIFSTTANGLQNVISHTLLKRLQVIYIKDITASFRKSENPNKQNQTYGHPNQYCHYYTGTHSVLHGEATLTIQYCHYTGTHSVLHGEA